MEIDAAAYHELLVRAFDKHYTDGTDVWSHDPAMRCFPALIEGQLKLPPTTRALDIGCGCGQDVAYMSRIYGPVTGLDIHAHRDWALLQEQQPNIRFVQGDLTQFSGEVPFDLILDNGCFHHQHPDTYPAYLQLVAGLLAADGCFALSTFKNETIERYWDENGRLHRYFSDTALHALLAAAGFEVFEELDIYRIHKGDYYRLSFCRKANG